ncbi:MAG: carboxypeptidase-like regulatory domain-containing protein [Terriglobales bacterium]
MNLTFFSRRPAASLSPEISLSQLRVASRCPAKWEEMAGDERVRHCAECDLNVYNLSAMTERQVQQLVAESRTAQRRLCARFYRRSDGTMITQDCPRGLRAAGLRVARMAAAILSALMSVSTASAKTKPQVCSLQSTSPQKQPGIWLQIMDPQGAVIPNAKIEVVDKSGKHKFSGATSASGELSVTTLPSGDYMITIAATGFRTYTSSVVIREQQVLQVKLKLAIAETRVEIEVTAEAPAVQGTLGMVTVIEKPADWPAAGPRGQAAPIRQ